MKNVQQEFVQLDKRYNDEQGRLDWKISIGLLTTPYYYLTKDQMMLDPIGSCELLLSQFQDILNILYKEEDDDEPNLS